jgi:surface-anchored protein
MSLQKIAHWFGELGNKNVKRKLRRRTKRQSGRSLRTEQLENRRLMVADLVNFLTQEHVDINIQNSGGVWTAGPRNSDSSPEIQYANDEAVMYAGAPSLTSRPAGSQYNFVGVGAGESFYLLPQSQDSDLLYLGFAAYGLTPSTVDRYSPTSESKGRVSSSARWAKASLMDVKHFNSDGSAGTGVFSLWQTGSFGDATVYMSSYNDGTANPDGNGLDVTDGVSSDDAMWIVAGGHAHFNFGFTKPGRYEVDLKLSTYFGDDGLNTPNTAGYSESEVITVYFSVINVGQLEVDESTYSVDESAATVSIDVVRVGGSDGRVTVDYATANGSAQTGSDYSSRTGTLEFLDGETRKTIVIPILEDGDEESNETFTLSLSNPKPVNIHDYVTTVEGDANGILGAITLATVTIVDNDQNTAPTISDVIDQTTDEDVSTNSIPFTVGDSQTAAGALVVTASSSNTSLVPNANIVLGGSSANRTVQVIPVADLFGSATITLTVTDAGGLTATDSFVLSVNSVNDHPTISDIPNQATALSTPTGAIAFTVGDVETTAGALLVSATSSNTALVPNGNIVLGGSGANRTITLTPIADVSGTTTITLTTTDEGGLTATDTFVLSVGVNQAPTISNIADRYVFNGESTGAIPFTVGDEETPVADLVITATSSDQSVIPNASIVLGGSGANRTITLNSLAGQVGTATITVTVTDATGGQSNDTFVLTVGDLVRATFNRSAGIVSATEPEDVLLADIDNDGDLDILFAKRITSISILPNNGDGTFGTEVALSALTVSAIHVADIDNDSLPDIVSSVYVDTTYAETAIAIWRNLGGGSFGGKELVESTRSTAFVGLTGVGDVDGDGLKDLVLSSDGQSWSRNFGGGTFGAATSISSGGVNYSSTLSDVDQDGDLDIVEAAYVDDEFKLRLFRNSGSLSPSFNAEVLETFGGESIGNLAIADTNADGFIDIHLIRGDSNRQVLALHGTTTGAFLPPTVLGSGPNLTDLKIGDIDGDGRADLALTAREQNMVHFAQNLGGGVFTELQQFSHDGSSLNPYPETVAIGDIDNDGRNDLVYSERFGNRIAWSRNRQEENITTLTPPGSRTYLNGYAMTFDVFLGFNAKLNTTNGSPTLPVTIGSQVISVPYIGQPNANVLRFRYQVQDTDVDLDGIDVATAIAMNGAILTDIHDRPIDPTFLQYAAVNTSDVLVNGGAPYVTGITRLDPNPVASTLVRFEVAFSELVTGVTIDDFKLDASGPTGASITSVEGSGSIYIVTASIGIGGGTLRLRVLDNDSIIDSDTHQLGGVGLGNGEFAYGQGYTIRTSSTTPTFNNIIVDGHLDFVLYNQPGDWYGFWYGDGWWETTDTVISAGPDAKANRPADAIWDFLGAQAGDPVWIFPETYSTTTPWPGVGAYFNNAGDFASYFEADPRINATAPWIKMQLSDVRGPDGGEFSLYQSDIAGPKVFMSSANGIGLEDTAWIPNLDHIHYNWAFSKPGLYQIDFVASGYIDANQSGVYEVGIDPLSESQIITLHFGVELRANDDEFATARDAILRGSVTLDDQSEWGIEATVATVESPTSKGTLTLAPNGSFTYQPSAAFDGTDSFVYRLTNPGGGFTTATVTITGSGQPEFDAVLKSGHTDIGVNFEEDAWDLHIHDHEPDTEYEPDEALFYVGRDAILTRSGDAADSAYDFLGVPVGETLFVLPEVENIQLPFLGIGGEELGEGLLQGDIATLRLASVSGPGLFSIWQSGSTPATPKLIMATSDGIDSSDAFEVAAGSHAHVNFGFTEKGFYEVTFVATGVDADGNATDSGQVTYYFFVTDGLVPFSMPNFLDAGLGVAGFQSQVADFNGDCQLDLIVAGSGADALGYRRGVGDGSFLPELSLNSGTGLSIQGIVAVDYDLDGDMDLIALEYVQSVENTGAVALFRNNGTASFTRVVLKGGLPTGYDVVAGDLNGDGRPDLVYNQGTSVAYALQQPSGDLGPETMLPATLNSVSGVKLGDMNGDGDLDIVVGNRANNPNAYFSLFSNDGNGVFAAPQNKTTGIFPDVHKLADMNGDGRLDVVTGESVVGSRAGYYPQLADGTFGSRVVVLPTNTQLNSITVGDINGDGVPDIAAGAIVGGRFSAVWSPGLGDGTFGATILMNPNEGNVFSIHLADLDADNYPDILTTGSPGTTAPSAVRVYLNKTGENPMVLIPPAARTRVTADPIDLDVFFGFPITVTGSPRIALQVGSEIRYATYLSGSGTPTLKFRYLVTSSDIDLDGAQLASNLIELNGGTMKDPLGGDAVLEFPDELFAGVFVNGAGPLVTGITRLDARSTEAATVRFRVQFNEDVTGVDLADFDIVMNAGDLSGATIQSLSGSGNQYEVTVTTGTGSGTLGLSVKGMASILDLSGVTLARAFVGGEVYTVRKTPIGELDIYYTDGHADYRPVFNNGEFSYVIHADTGVLPQDEYDSEEVYTYADSNAIVNRSTSPNYNFLGVGPGQPLYILPSTQNVNLPFLGLSGESLVAGTFAAYRPTEDPRITSSTIREYVKVQMVGMRSSSGGEFSLYSGTTPTVWMASSDGIGDTDSFWLYRTHFHRNLAFSKAGIYEIDVFISGYLDSNGNGIKDATDVYVESGVKTMVFNVDTLGAQDDVFTLTAKQMLHGSVTVNDTWDESLGIATASLESSPSKGSLSFSTSGAFTYVPNDTFSGTDSFTYRLTNSRGGYTIANVMLSEGTLPEFDAVLLRGHADIGLAIGTHEHGIGGFAEEPAWDLHVHDEENDIEYHADEALLYVGPEAETIRQGGAAAPAFDFLGVAPGETFYVLSETENPDLLFLGIGSEEIDVGTLLNGSAKLQLVAVNGPGEFSAWNSGSASPLLRMATRDGITLDDYITVLEGSHSHVNFAFSKKGEYQITFLAIGSLADGTEVHGENVTYFFRVDNEAPIANAETFAVSAGNSLHGNVLFNDSDPNGDHLSAQLQSSTSKGTLTLHADGSFVYVPSSMFDGTDSFTYTVNDPFEGTMVGQVSITQAPDHEFVVDLGLGHVDIGLALGGHDGGGDTEWDLHVHDEEADVEYHPDEAMLLVNATARKTRAGGAAASSYDFLGVAPGGVFYVLPEVFDVNQMFLGISAEEIEAGTFQNGNAKLRLISVNGPGEFSIWKNDINGPVVQMATSDGIVDNDFVTVLEGGHSHYNYAFTQLGNYEITVQATATLASGEMVSSGYVTYFFRVANLEPTVEGISDVVIDEDAGLQSINLTEINGGIGEQQDVRISVTSSNTALIPTPSLSYVTSETVGSLRFTPTANASGSSTITVRLEDAGFDGDFATTGDNAILLQTFEVVVNPVNDAPTLAPLSNRIVQEDAATQTVSFAGIAAGGGEVQSLRVTATSSNSALIPHPTVNYTSPAASGTLNFTPVADQSGVATITVTVEDGGLDNDLSTLGDNGSTSQTFVVTVNAVNDLPTLDVINPLSINEDASEQTVGLTGISAGGGESQPIRVVVSSSNTGLIPNPTLVYQSPNSTGTLQFTPVANKFGTATITVTVTDGGLDNDLNTTVGNLSFTRTFVINVQTVNDRPIAINDSYNVLINSATDLDVLANDSDVEDGASSGTIEIVSQPQGGSVSVQAGKIRFTPNLSRLGTDQFSYRIIDSNGAASDVATVGLNLSEVPLTNSDSFSIAKNSTYRANVLANDQFLISPLNSGSLAVAAVSPTGTAVVENGRVLITPATGYVGAVTFTYTLTNSLGVLSPATSVTVNVLDRGFQNPIQRHDVNGDWYVSAIDALIIINELNRRGARPLDVLSDATPPFFDVNGDFAINAIDALSVINFLNARHFGGASGGGASGEGEGPVEDGIDYGSLQDHVDAALVEMLAEDHNRRQRAWVRR